MYYDIKRKHIFYIQLIYNNLILAKNKDIPVFSKNFCSPNIWSYFVENFNKNDFIVEADGAYDEADRRIISFNNKSI